MVFRIFFCIFWFLTVIFSPQFSTSLYAFNIKSKKTTPDFRIFQRSCIKRLIKIKKNHPNLTPDIISLFNSELGYAFIGAKPVSFYEEGASINCLLLATLEKEFANSHEIIFKTTTVSSKKKEICVINKKSFLKCVKEHSILQVFIKKHFLSAAKFLHIFKQSSLPLAAFCKYDHTIIGILLGFGEKNASKWVRWNELSRFLGVWNVKRSINDMDPGMIAIRYFSVHIPKAHNIPKVNREFHSLYSEWNFLNKGKRLPCEGLTPPFCIYLPEFFYWEDQNESMSKFIKDRNTLGIVLSQLDIKQKNVN